jgi:bifunctional NMN adenylyltransferase/nudix hydrolase
MSSIHSKEFAAMKKEFDFLVFIGRFQPFHLGHLSVVEAGLVMAERVVILCGSSHRPRSVRNPWNADERTEMIYGAIDEADRKRVHVMPLMDIIYNDEAWVSNVQMTVNGVVTAHHGIPHSKAKIGLIGHSKDHSSYYLNLFPQWGSVDVENFNEINATRVRGAFFSAESGKYLERSAIEHLPSNVLTTIKDFATRESFKHIRDEHEFLKKYKSAWGASPYPPIFVTVDAVVVQSGHVLMVERKARPGKGLTALPGGFVGANEKLMDACLRELREETRLKIPAPVIQGSIKHQMVFDDPHRSERGRTITHAFYIELKPDKQLPKVKGGDDAKHARWVPLAELDPSQIYDDHYFIIKEMAGM